MLWDCRFTWYPGTTSARVRERVLQQHAAGTNHPEMIRGWYNRAGGGAGFLMIEATNPHDLNVILEPYMDLMSWEIQCVYELPYEQVTRRFQETVQAAGMRSEEMVQDTGMRPEAIVGAEFESQTSSGSEDDDLVDVYRIETEV